MHTLYHIRQLELLAPNDAHERPKLPDSVLHTVRSEMQTLLMEAIIAERQQQERCDEQDHA